MAQLVSSIRSHPEPLALPVPSRKWLNLSGMAEINHPRICNFSSPPAFQSVVRLERLPIE